MDVAKLSYAVCCAAREVSKFPKLLSLRFKLCLRFFFTVLMLGMTWHPAQAQNCGEYDPSVALNLGKQYRDALRAKDYALLKTLKQRKEQIELWQQSLEECSGDPNSPINGDNPLNRDGQPPLPDDATDKAKECEQIRANLDRAMATECAYKGAHEACRLAGYEIVGPREMISLGLDPARFHERGFHAELLKRNGKYTLSFRGTSFGKRGDGWADALDDMEDWGQSLGRTTSQYVKARDLAEHIKKSKISVDEVVGHSLGGGLATVAALALNKDAHIYNPQALHPDVAKDLDIKYSRAAQRVVATVIEGEALTAAQDLGSVPVPTYQFSLATQLLLAARFDNCTIRFCLIDSPSHPGKRNTLKPAYADRESGAIARHGMDMVIRAIESQLASNGCAPSNYNYGLQQ